MIKSKFKRVTSLFLATLMCVTTFAGIGSTTAYAASGEKADVYMVDFPRDGDANYDGVWGHSNLTLKNGWHTGRSNFTNLKAIGSYSGNVAYCIEPGISLKVGQTMNKYDENYFNNLAANGVISGDEIRLFVGRILQYGYRGTISTSWRSQNEAAANSIAQAYATQLLIWETVIGERDANFNHVAASGCSNVKDVINAKHPLRNKIFSYYNSMVQSVQNHATIPSFCNKSSGSAKTIELEWNGSKYTTTLTDSNNVLSKYNFKASISGVSFSVNGNKLTVSMDTAPSKEFTITATKKNAVRRGVVVWSEGKHGQNSSVQDVVSYAQEVSDSINGYVKMKVSYGSCQIVKTSEDGKADGINFTITGNGINQTVTTANGGKFQIDNLMPGIYTVTEQAYDKYEPQETHRVTVVAGQIAKVTFNNKLKRGDLQVVKSSEDNLVEGVKFHLFGTSLSGDAVDQYAVTDKNGVATFKDVLISGSEPYTLEEVDTAIRYVVPKNQTAPVKWKEVTTRNFNNILKKFTVTVTKSDAEKGEAQGNAKLSGAVYGIYKGETLVDKYVTDENGQFTTKEYVCDTDWTIREITPSEGYLLDKTIHEVGADPKLYEVEHNLTSNDVTEQVIKGNVAIIKHTDDGETKIENNPSATNNKLYAVATIGRDSAESGALKKKIENFFVNNPESNAIVIDSSTCVLGEGEYNEFVENYAMSLAIGNSDLDQRKTYEGYAIEVLSNWAKRIKCGDFYVYSRYATNGERVANIQDLFIYLLDIDKFHYPQCLEGAYTSVLNTMYDANSLGNGATCGINEETKGTFRSGNEATKLENALKGAWKVPEYWNNSHSYIADLKKTVDEFINETFNKSDRISIASIYEMLKAEPYGFMPCNLTAFILGFILKEYTKGVYSYSDNLTTVPLDAEKLASMISEIIKQDNTPEKRYKDKFIVTLTEEERAFNKATSVAFDIPEMYCVSVTETRSRIREQMKGFSFPIWVIKYVLDDKTFKTDKDVVSKLIDNYCGIANNKNMEGEKSDNDIALTIGKLCLDNDGVVDDLKSILTKDNCKSGMLEYLKLYDGGKLPAVAEKINDGGQYINQLQYKFSSDAANWVWNTDTVNAKIDELICEYEIIEISNGVLSKNATYMEAIRAWVDKIGQIRLAYSMIKNELGDSKAFYEMLYNLYKQRNLLDSQKKPFLDLLRENIENFKYFMGSQSSLFIKACSFYLDDLSEEDVKSILDDDTYGFGGSYLLERDKYTDKVQKAVDLYKNAQLYTQLKKKWNDLTDTDSPYMWSNKYHMPILAMVPDDEVATARKVFGAINSKTKDENTITTALDYLDKMTYVQKLNNKEDRDKAFRDVFLEEFSELFDDVDEVRTYLQNHISDSPYHWLGNKAVTAKIKTMANAKYNESGYGKAKKVIDEMPAEQVKEYLKKMIEDNFVVGLEIIKKQK